MSRASDRAHDLQPGGRDRVDHHLDWGRGGEAEPVMNLRLDFERCADHCGIKRDGWQPARPVASSIGTQSLLTYRFVGFADPVKSIQRDDTAGMSSCDRDVMVVGWERSGPLAAGGSCVGRKARDRPDPLESMACFGVAHFPAESLCRSHGAA